MINVEHEWSVPWENLSILNGRPRYNFAVSEDTNNNHGVWEPDFMTSILT